MSGAIDVPLPMRAVTADRTLFTVVRDWTRDSIRPVRLPESCERRATLLIKTPGPWTSLVAFAALTERELTPLLVLKNSVSLWAVHRQPPDGVVSPGAWLWLRHLCLPHNPGLDGALTIIGAAVP